MNQIKEHIFTVNNFHEEKFKEKGSVFIGQAHPVKNEDNFTIFLNEAKKKYYDASHFCYAYKLADESFKYSDAGEPNGTAGIRIFNAIQHFDFTDIAVIVVRYFGGTKLGVGPLGKAYYKSAFDVLEKSEKVKLCSFYRIFFEVGFDEISHPHRICENFNAVINDIKYERNVRFDCLIKPGFYNEFSYQLKEALNRNIEIKKDEKIYYRKC